MKDLSNPFWIKLKGILFLCMGITAVIMIFIGDPRWETGALIAVAIWSFCRFYYFAFYVIEKYVDPGYKFSSLIDFAKYLLRRRP